MAHPIVPELLPPSLRTTNHHAITLGDGASPELCRQMRAAAARARETHQTQRLEWASIQTGKPRVAFFRACKHGCLMLHLYAGADELAAMETDRPTDRARGVPIREGGVTR
jgi:hypothetical protein